MAKHSMLPLLLFEADCEYKLLTVYMLIKATDLSNLSKRSVQCSVIPSPPAPPPPSLYKSCVHHNLSCVHNVVLKRCRKNLSSLVEIGNKKKSHKLVPWGFPRT